MDLIAKPLGSEGNVKLVIGGGKLKLVAEYDSKGLDGSVSLAVDSDYFIDELAAKIPGQIDDLVFGVLKQALKQL